MVCDLTLSKKPFVFFTLLMALSRIVGYIGLEGFVKILLKLTKESVMINVFPLLIGMVILHFCRIWFILAIAYNSPY